MQNERRDDKVELRHVEFGIREALGLDEELIAMNDHLARLVEAAENLSRIMEELDLEVLANAAASIPKVVRSWVPALAQAPPVSRGQKRMWWLRQIQRTVEASGS